MGQTDKDIKRQLFDAIRKEDVRTLLQLKAAGVDWEMRENDDATPLVVAVHHNRWRSVKIALDAGAKVNARTKNGITALMVAAHGNVECMQMLIAAGADLDLQDSEGFTALMHAVWNQEEAAVAELLAAGADIHLGEESGRTAYGLACLWKDSKIGKMLLDAGATALYAVTRGERKWKAPEGDADATADLARLHAFDLWKYLDSFETDPPLVQAAFEGDLPRIRALLAMGADVNAAGVYGNTALMSAVTQGHPKCVRYLLEAGADMELMRQYPGGFAPENAVIAALCAGEDACLVELLLAGAAIDEDGIREAVLQGFSQSLQYLLDHRREVLPAPAPDSWLVRIATYKRHPKLLQMLLDAGYGTAAIGKYGERPLAFAAWADDIRLLKPLLAAGADINAREAKGRTALMYAVANRSHKVLPLLIEAGADLDAEDGEGLTALRLATREGDETALRLLAAAGASL